MPKYTIQLTKPPYPETEQVILVSPEITNVDYLSTDLVDNLGSFELTNKKQAMFVARAMAFTEKEPTRVEWNR